MTAGVQALLQERHDRRKEELDAFRRDVHFAVGCWTRSTRPSRRARCSPRWVPSWSSRALHKIRAGSTSPRCGAYSPSSTSNACASTSDDLTASAATWMLAHHRKRLARTACPSTRCRSCSSLKFTITGRTYLCAGQAWMRRATRGSRSTT